MRKIILVIELEYDDEMMHWGDEDAEAKRWFDESVLGSSKLCLHENGDLGDEVGHVRILERR